MFKKREIIQNPADTGTPDVIMMPAGQRRRFWRKFTANRLGVIGVAIIIALVGVASLANILAPYSYKEQELSAMYLPPSAEHWMGTDEFGRDVLSRVIHGSRISVYVGVVSVGLSVIIGVFIQDALYDFAAAPGLCIGIGSEQRVRDAQATSSVARDRDRWDVRDRTSC